jgi:mRNA interferase MazF
MEKDFDGWNKIKKQTHEERPRLYTVREIWWCRLGVNIGTEQDGKGEWYVRPCVIIRGFGPDACLVIPLTTSEREHPLRVPIGLVEGFEARANLSQIRVIDTRRLEEKVGFLEKEVFLELRKAARDMFSDGSSDILPLAGARPKPTVQ